MEQSLDALLRIAEALERLAPKPPAPVDLLAYPAYVWDQNSAGLRGIQKISGVSLDQLQAIDQQKEILLRNTQTFAKGLPANNALLWGARGMGKSSLVKAVATSIQAKKPKALALVEIHREDIQSLPLLLRQLAPVKRQFLVFCDDLTFDAEDVSYKSLKGVLEGGIEGRPPNVLFYATSNRRHIVPRAMIENEQQSAIHGQEAVEEKISLSDRFGIWLGFYPCSQDEFFAMVAGYVETLDLLVKPAIWQAEAIEWSMTRGGRSGRVAYQYVQDLAGRMGKNV